MGDSRPDSPLSARVWSSSAHPRSQRASECKADGCVPGKGTNKRVASGKGVQGHAAFPANRVASGSQISGGAGSKAFRRTFSTLLALAVLVHPGPAQAKCRTHHCWARVSEKRHQHFWPKRLHAQPQGWQAWAWKTSGCESNHRRVARESGYWSYFQWTLQTWHVAGGRANPEQHSYEEQAVKAIRYARHYGTGAWPVCGH